MLGHVRRGAGVLAAEGNALHDAEEDEQQRRADPKDRVAGQEADRRRGRAHHQQRDEERRLASDGVAESAEHERAERADRQPDGVGGEGAEEAEGWLVRRVEVRGNDRREAREDEEIVELDDRPDG